MSVAPDPQTAILAHPAVTRVRERLAAAGVDGRVVVLDGAARTAAQAAEFLGVGIGQIANSLVFTFVPDAAPESVESRPQPHPEPLLVLTSGAHRVDTALLERHLAGHLGRADADFVRTRTGFVIGGVAPVGHLHPVRTLIDRELAGYERIWAAAGHPHTVFPTTFAELVRLTGGEPVDVA